MYNRKFDIKIDFDKLTELEYKIIPIIRDITDKKQKEYLENYVRKTFHNQWKK